MVIYQTKGCMGKEQKVYHTNFKKRRASWEFKTPVPECTYSFNLRKFHAFSALQPAPTLKWHWSMWLDLHWVVILGQKKILIHLFSLIKSCTKMCIPCPTPGTTCQQLKPVFYAVLVDLQLFSQEWMQRAKGKKQIPSNTTMQLSS